MSVKKIFAISLSLIMAFTMIPGFACLQIAYAENSSEVLAAQSDVIGRLNGKGYSSFKKLVDDLEDNYANGKVTIEMTANWNAAGSSDFDRRLIIPKGCTASQPASN